jgi:outer membrane protein assembly factor BamB
VVAADAYGAVMAFDRFNGKRIWKVAIGKPDRAGFVRRLYERRDPAFVSGGIGAGDGRVYLGTTGGDVVALAVADGAEVWRVDVRTEIVAPPVYDAGLLFVQTIDGRLMARDAATGASVWTFDSQVPILTLRGTSTPVVADDVVYTGFANGMVVAIKKADGERLWQNRVMLPQGRSELERMVDVDAAPLIDGPMLYAVSYHGKLQGVRRADGRPLWEISSSSFLDLALGYGQIYVVEDDDLLKAIDRESTTEVWQQDGLLRRKLSAPVAYNNYVLVGDNDGFLHVLAQSDGRFLARKKLDGDGLRSAFVVADDIVYVFGNGGSLVALELTANDQDG